MQPDTENALTEIVRGAVGPIAVTGGGTRRIGEPGGARLDTGGLTGITLYEPGALTLVVRAGTPLAKVDNALAAERQRLAFEVPDLRGLLGRMGESTIGGVVAANASGPRRIQAGACRDSLLGVRFVDGAGRIIKNGGRVMKNVTGLDLTKLMAGSQGSLGVLTEVSLKVQAVPEAEATLVVPAASAAAGVAVLTQALGSPYDVTGAAFDGRALVRIEGMAGSVAYRAGALQGLIGGDVVTGEDSAAMWRSVRDVVPLQGVAGAIWRISVKPTDGPHVLASLGDVPYLLDWGGGLVWCALPDDVATSLALRAVVTGFGGHATRLNGMAAVHDAQPEAPGLAQLTKALRHQFDPRGLFTSHLFSPGLLATA
ncbi:MAG: FAD-binding protein [Paracoccaceae bacterium]